MHTFSRICRDIFLLAQRDLPSEAGPRRGQAWEDLVFDYLLRHGVPVESVPGGSRAFGHVSLSGLAHQLDGALGCADALVLAEWKAYRGTFPKNELLRFKAATDDYYTAFGHNRLSRPVLRLFGGVGMASESLRAYAALHGIALIESERCPLALLAASDFIWPGDPTSGPSFNDCRTLCWGVRPLQSMLRPHPSGGYLLPRPESSARLRTLLQLHDQWSDRLWEALDAQPDKFYSLYASVWNPPEAA